MYCIKFNADVNLNPNNVVALMDEAQLQTVLDTLKSRGYTTTYGIITGMLGATLQQNSEFFKHSFPELIFTHFPLFCPSAIVLQVITSLFN
jgi:hypothetical protein